MFRIAERTLVSVLWLGLSMGLSLGANSCAKKAPETSAVPPAAVSVTGLELGRGIGADKRVPEKVDDFGPKDVIYASVLTSGTSPHAVLKARWTYQDGQLVEESEQAIAPTADAATEFHISKPDGWPVGKYQVEVFLDGSSVQRKDFEVK